MSDLPTFGEVKETVSDTVEHGRNLIPWLPDPPTCPDCNSLQYADVTYSSELVQYVTSWHCKECDVHRYRDPEFGESDVPGPRSGASKLRELL